MRDSANTPSLNINAINIGAACAHITKAIGLKSTKKAPKSTASPLQHRMQQHIAPGLQVLQRGVFDFVVADAVFAWDEDHTGGCQLGHVHRVVACARHHWHVAVTQLVGGSGNRVNAVFVKADG